MPGRFAVLCSGSAIVFAGCGGLSHDGEGAIGAAGTGGLAGKSEAGGSGVAAGETGFAGAGGAPVCTGGEVPILCDGECIDSNQDNANCGTCGHVCASPAACTFGSCRR